MERQSSKSRTEKRGRSSLDQSSFHTQHRCLVELGGGDYFGNEDLVQVENQMRKLKATSKGRVRLLRAFKRFRRDLDQEYASMKNASPEPHIHDPSEDESDAEHDCHETLVGEIMANVREESQNASVVESLKNELKSTKSQLAGSQRSINSLEKELTKKFNREKQLTKELDAFRAQSQEGEENEDSSDEMSESSVESESEDSEETTNDIETTVTFVRRGQMFECDFPGCSFKRPYRSEILIHRYQHFPPSFKCGIDGCGSIYTYPNGLRNHKRNHSSIKSSRVRPFKCPKCDVPYKRVYSFKKHIAACRFTSQ